jgi:hypothetical protein
MSLSDPEFGTKRIFKLKNGQQQQGKEQNKRKNTERKVGK